MIQEAYAVIEKRFVKVDPRSLCGDKRLEVGITRSRQHLITQYSRGGFALVSRGNSWMPLLYDNFLLKFVNRKDWNGKNIKADLALKAIRIR